MNLLLDNIIFSLQKVGGISIYWKELLKRVFLDPEINLNVISIDSCWNNFIFQELINEYPGIGNVKRIIPLVNNRYLPIMISHKEKTIFHSSYYRPIYYPKVKSVTTIHDFIYEKFDTGLKKHIHSLQKKLSIENSDVIICISENTRNDLLEIYPQYENKDIRVIYNGVSENYYKLPDQREGRPFLLVVGNRVGCKNFDIIIKSFKKDLYKNYLLKIVGKPLTDEERAKFGTVIDRVEVYSNVPEVELNKLYNSAFALIFPSTYEGFGIPVVEAMRAGCPVVTTTCSCMKEVGGDAALYMDSVDADSIITAVRRLENENIRYSAIERGLIHGRKFSWDSTYNQIKSLYQELNER